MKCIYVLLAVAVMAVVVSAAPQEQPQEQPQQRPRPRPRPRPQPRPNQQGGRNQRPNQQRAQQQATAAAAGRAQPTATTADQQLLDDPNLTLNKISQKDLNKFLSSKQAVDELVLCFEHLSQCRTQSAISLVADVRQLGRGARCKDCTEAEQQHTRRLVNRAISGLQQRHPKEWRRVLPHIGFLL